jgi:hypothetical protein
MKNLFFIPLFLGLLTVVFTSCKKDKKSEVSPIVGFWQGQYMDNRFTGDYFYAVLFRNNGTLREFKGDPIAGGIDTASSRRYEGSWDLLSTGPGMYYRIAEIGGTYSYISTTVDPAFIHIEGTWGTGGNATGMGTFLIDKQ